MIGNNILTEGLLLCAKKKMKQLGILYGSKYNGDISLTEK